MEVVSDFLFYLKVDNIVNRVLSFKEIDLEHCSQGWRKTSVGESYSSRSTEVLA